MGITETYELLKNRIGWKQPADASFVVTPDNQLSDSGRHYQDEHPAITLKNLHETIDIVNANDADFNTVLADLEKRAIIHVLSSVFTGISIRDFTSDLSVFDFAISKSMAVIVLELILNSTRSNLSERILKNNSKWFYDLNGGSGNKNFPDYIGLRQTYAKEIDELKDRFNSGNATLDSFTLRIGDSEPDPTLL